MLCSCFFSYSYSASRYSYSYSKHPSIAIRHIGPQVTANRFDRRSASPQFKQPSSTSTVSLSTVRRGGLSTSTTKSEARHERKDHRGRGIASPASAMPYALGPRSARPTGSTALSATGRLRRKVGMVEMIRLADEPWAPVAQGHPEAEVVRSVRVALRDMNDRHHRGREVNKCTDQTRVTEPLACMPFFCLIVLAVSSFLLADPRPHSL
jgi:hypothetical protein